MKRAASSSTRRTDERRARRPPPRAAPPVATRRARSPAAGGDGRIDTVDAARGAAVTMMIAYHFCFDLTFYGWAAWPMLDDARWIAWRSTIVASFLFVVGVSLALRDANDRRRGSDAWLDRGFLRRWLQVAAAALLVSAGSAVLFPQTFIYFGVLHFVAVALWVCRRAPRLGGGAVVAGIAVLAVGLLLSTPAFDAKAVNWIGFAAEKPITEDYVPLIPWLGVVLLGCGAGAYWARHGFATSASVDRVFDRVPSSARRLLAVMGRRSLTIYLLHQPVLLGVLGAVRKLTT